MLRKLGMGIVGLAVVAGATAVNTGTAAAASWPVGCSHGTIDGGSTARCTSPYGEYKASVACRTFDGQTVFREAGFWQRGGGASFAFCPENNMIVLYSGNPDPRVVGTPFLIGLAGHGYAVSRRVQSFGPSKFGSGEAPRLNFPGLFPIRSIPGTEVTGAAVGAGAA